jgi:hypothetical protein
MQSIRERHYGLFGAKSFKIFGTIRSCCEPGKPCEPEELCIDVSRILLSDELPADQQVLGPPAGVAEAVANVTMTPELSRQLDDQLAAGEKHLAAGRWQEALDNIFCIITYQCIVYNCIL